MMDGLGLVRRSCAVSVVALGLWGGAARGVDVVVDKAGAVKTIQAALDALPAGQDEVGRILIKPGEYVEHLSIRRPHVCLVGLGKDPKDVVISYNLSAVSPKEGGGTVGTTGSTSVTIGGHDFVASNVTFANSTPDNVAQAVAVKTQADRVAFDHCRFVGFQDTLYPTGGRQYFGNCYVTGDTDFIFGNATAVFDHCVINSSDAGYVTAANTSATTPVGYVFLDCELTAGPNVKPGSTWLGRPWQWDRGPVASVAFVRTKMGPHVQPAGWNPWDAKKNTEPAKTTRFSEFGTVDAQGKPVDLSKRVAWAHRLTEDEAGKLTVSGVLRGEDGWDPKAAIEECLKGVAGR